MTDHLPELSGAELRLPVDSRTHERLRGDACMECGSREDLVTAPHLVFTRDDEGHRFGWVVRVCGEHRPRSMVR